MQNDKIYKKVVGRPHKFSSKMIKYTKKLWAAHANLIENAESCGRSVQI